MPLTRGLFPSASACSKITIPRQDKAKLYYLTAPERAAARRRHAAEPPHLRSAPAARQCPVRRGGSGSCLRADTFPAARSGAAHSRAAHGHRRRHRPASRSKPCASLTSCPGAAWRTDVKMSSTHPKLTARALRRTHLRRSSRVGGGRSGRLEHAQSHPARLVAADGALTPSLRAPSGPSSPLRWAGSVPLCTHDVTGPPARPPPDRHGAPHRRHTASPRGPV